MNDAFEGVRRIGGAARSAARTSRAVLRARALRRARRSRATSRATSSRAPSRRRGARGVRASWGTSAAVAVMLHRALGRRCTAAGFRPCAPPARGEPGDLPSPRRTPSSRPMPYAISAGSSNARETASAPSSSSRRPRSSCEQIGYTWIQASSAPRHRRALPRARPAGDRRGAGARGAPPLVAAGRSPVIVYAVASLARLAAAQGDIERAGRLWGAIEAEECSCAARATGTRMRDEYAAAIVTSGDAEFETARRAGRRVDPGPRQSTMRSREETRRLRRLGR